MKYIYCITFTLVVICGCTSQPSQITTRETAAAPENSSSPAPLTPKATTPSAISAPQDEITEAVKAYAKKEGFPCNQVTSKTLGKHSSLNAPKYEVACDNGKSKFMWVRYTTGEVNVLPLL